MPIYHIKNTKTGDYIGGGTPPRLHLLTFHVLTLNLLFIQQNSGFSIHLIRI